MWQARLALLAWALAKTGRQLLRLSKSRQRAPIIARDPLRSLPRPHPSPAATGPRRQGCVNYRDAGMVGGLEEGT
jgi:hypothetical protein